MIKKNKSFFCEKCGSLMKLEQREGHIRRRLNNSVAYYDKKYDCKTGKLLRVYCCPNFGIVKGSLFTDDTLNAHDCYSE